MPLDIDDPRVTSLAEQYYESYQKYVDPNGDESSWYSVPSSIRLRWRLAVLPLAEVLMKLEAVGLFEPLMDAFKAIDLRLTQLGIEGDDEYEPPSESPAGEEVRACTCPPDPDAPPDRVVLDCSCMYERPDLAIPFFPLVSRN